MSITGADLVIIAALRKIYLNKFMFDIDFPFFIFYN